MLKPLVAAMALTLIPLAANAADFIEGKHYTQIAKKGSEEPKLTEFFSFYCHNCFSMETQYLPDIKAGLNKEVSFDNKHVDFMNSDLGTEVMKSLAIMQELGATDKLVHPMFAAIQGEEGAHGHDHSAPGHKHTSAINSRDDIKQLFAANGVDVSQYDALADSKKINDVIALWRKQQNEFAIQSVPSFVVNDKYMVNLGEIRTLGELTDLINFLATEKDAKQDEGGSLGWLFLAFAGVAAVTRRRR
ncbi:DsbA family protein [Shewanella algae]|uniref:DsbA family protein n=1 Tax=Shewanella algae TaxID=38313 RepID=UPI000B8B15F4|nr:DsbA family protein [Shewanella algae]OXS01979.1 disulfide bond formation protein DsbA [Shewanella algae]